MSVRLCVGKYALQPYCFTGLNLKVYCIEELCYALKENAFLLDMEVMSDRLVDWLGKECGLEDLAVELHSMVHKKGSLSAYICRILEYAGFYEQETVRKIEQTLKKGAGLNVLEKRKLRVDYLVEQKKYQAAVSEYDALLSVWEENGGDTPGGELPGGELKAAILHNRGTALAGLMLYKEASDSYRRAYETDLNQESLKCYLAACRMGLNDSDYVAYAASLPQCAEIVLDLEKQVEQIGSQWQQEADYMRLVERGQLREEDERSYLEDNSRRLLALKESYRSMVS